MFITWVRIVIDLHEALVVAINGTSHARPGFGDTEVPLHVTLRNYLILQLRGKSMLRMWVKWVVSGSHFHSSVLGGCQRKGRRGIQVWEGCPQQMVGEK